MDIVKRIRSEMVDKNIKQKELVKLLGESQSAISKWLSENEDIRNDIPITILAKIAKIIDVDVEYLIGTQEQKKIEQSNNVTMVPMVDIKAGAGAEGLLPDFITSERVPIWTKFLNGINPKNLAIFQVVGDSMAPDINPDDWVMIDMVNGRHFDPVDAIYLINRDGSIQIKRLAFKGAKGIDIISKNTDYRVENTIDDNIELFVIGKLYRHIRTLGALAIKD